MRKLFYLHPAVLDLFDGAAGAGAAGTGSGEGNAAAAGQQTGADGAEAAIDTAAAGQETTQGDESPADREAKFRELIEGEYKEQYGKEVQKVISRRIKDAKALEQQLSDQQAVIDRLASKYGIRDNDMKALGEAIDSDTSLWEEAADAAGMSVDQYMKFQALQRQNADLIRQEQARTEQARRQQTIQRLMGEGEALKQQFPSFDLERELASPQFAALIKNGVPLEHAYKVLHFDELQAATAQAVAGRTEKAVTDNIRAQGSRPVENGSKGGYGASETKIDVHKLTKEGRQELINRARRGEIISF